MNHSRSHQGGNAFVWARVDLRPKPGDILYVAMPEHVCVLEKLDEDTGTISVFEYGQWDAKRQKPSGKRTETTFSVGAKNLKVGNRTLRGWLDIARIPGLLQLPRGNVDSTLIARIRLDGCPIESLYVPQTERTSAAELGLGRVRNPAQPKGHREFEDPKGDHSA